MEDQDIRGQIDLFYQSVEMPGGYSHSVTDTLKTIDLYWNSKYKNGNRDSRGFYKYFYNIVHPASDIGSKFTDLDTKNILLWPEIDGQEEKIWVMQHKLKQWLKESDFGEFLNKVNADYPKYGHVFAKKVGSEWKKINIQNVRFNPGSDCFDTDEFFHEVLTMSRSEILKMKWNQKDAIESLLKDKSKTFIIYACHVLNENGKWDRTFRGRMFDKTENGQTIRTTEAEYNKGSDYLPSLILHKDEVKDIEDLYRELKWEEVPGRRLGMGFVEYLFDNQIAENEAENLERKALHHKALQLYQTRDAGMRRNILTDAENGDILTVDSEITVVAKDNSDLAAFNATRARWSQNSQSKTFSYDSATGANLPSRTPLGVANISVAMVTSYFKNKRDNFGMFVSEILLDDVIPAFQDESASEQMMFLKGTEDGLETLLRSYAKSQVASKAWDWAMGKGGGYMPNEESIKAEEERIFQDLSSRKGVALKVPDGYFRDAKYSVDIVTTGEQIDIQNMTQTIQTVLQLYFGNPQVMQSKPARAMVFKLLSLSGISPVDLDMMEESFKQNPQQPEMGQGGSISPTTPNMSPSMIQSTQVQ